MTEALYEIADLKHQYQGRTVLDIPRLSLEAGAITGLAGPNGSGKSTLLRLLALIERPTSGSLLFKGRPMNGAGPELRCRISLVLQEPYLLHRSVEANVAYGLKVRGDTRGATRRVSQALGWVGLDPDTFARRSWRELSGGEAQRVALAARLVLRPEVLLLDEPTTSLDAASAALIKDAAVRAHRGWGASLIVASHDLTWLHAVCGRVLGMHRGRLRAAGPLNVLPGPWVPDERPGLMRMELGDGQVLRVGAAGGASLETAALDPAGITLTLDQPQTAQEMNLLKGEIVGLTLQRDTGQVLVQVAVDRLPLMVRISAEQARGPGLHPGALVWLSFPVEVVAG